MQRRKLYLIKFGGSLITSKKSAIPIFDSEKIKRLGREIHENLPKNAQLIIGHGAGSFGHPAAMRFLKDLPNLSPEQIEQRLKAIRAEVRILAQEVKSCLSAFFDVNLVDHTDVARILQDGRVALIHGDVNFDGPPYIISTEDQFLEIAKKISDDFEIHVILATDSEVKNPAGEIYDRLSTADLDKFEFNKHDATGGMRHKVEVGLSIRTYANSVLIVNGNSDKRVARILQNELAFCTEIVT